MNNQILTDPFSLLGFQFKDDKPIIRAHLPQAERVWVENKQHPMTRIEGTNIFECIDYPLDVPKHYQLLVENKDGHEGKFFDPYTFAAVIPEQQFYLFNEGTDSHAYEFLGSHQQTVDGVDGVNFAVWAPTAKRVSVVGGFNRWDGHCHPMRHRGGSGVWELFVPGVRVDECYKYQIETSLGDIIHKSDPYAYVQLTEEQGCSQVSAKEKYLWKDQDWQQGNTTKSWKHTPLAVYECHLGSWQRGMHGEILSYRQLTEILVPYVKTLGFSHIQLMPIAEHPFYGSWGYQVTGYFAPSHRYGSPEDLRYFVDSCHQQNIGVLLDWVPGHFPKDDYALARFDGSALYEHDDPRRSEHKEWSTLIFNYARCEVKSFLLSNAAYWLREFHFDGLRMDAVASMLYLDYGAQDEGSWLPNSEGGNENYDAADFLRQVNFAVKKEFPHALLVAEESTTWPKITAHQDDGGLGFDMKWDMGWMHDTLNYFSEDPIHRKYHHNKLTFGMMYHHAECYMASISHDEVVYGKKSLLSKMPGDPWQAKANLRVLLGYQYTYPSKKLLFMGQEFGQLNEWNHDVQLDWSLLEYEPHRQLKNYVSKLNALYQSEKSLFASDYEEYGFEWLDCNDKDQSTLSFYRMYQDEITVVVLNLTPVVREEFRLALPRSGKYSLAINSDELEFGGSGVIVCRDLDSQDIGHMGYYQSAEIVLPPLAIMVFKYEA